jgi:hypothetical protein
VQLRRQPAAPKAILKQMVHRIGRWNQALSRHLGFWTPLRRSSFRDAVWQFLILRQAHDAHDVSWSRSTSIFSIFRNSPECLNQRC